MSFAPFAALEARVNNAVFARLPNAEVSIDGAPAFGGIFDEGAAVGSVGPLGMADTRPSVLVPSAQVPSAPVGLGAVVNGVAYLIGAVEPDGAGAVRLLLESAL